MSPISSRKTVPPLACSKRPRLVACAPVKAPRTCPKSSLSSSPSGIAVQLIGTKGLSARLPWKWIVRATTSLPVPLSPLIKTLLRLCAICRMSAKISRMAGLVPISSPSWLVWSTARRRRRFSSSSTRRSKARSIAIRTTSGSKGFVT